MTFNVVSHGRLRGLDEPSFLAASLPPSREGSVMSVQKLLRHYLGSAAVTSISMDINGQAS
jgi:hypothetical protein